MSSLLTSFDLSVRSLRVVVMVGFLSLPLASSRAEAGFSVTSLDLRSSVRSSVIGESLTDAETIDQISNPLLNTTMGQIGDNVASSSYDFSWVEEIGIGDFNTTFTHTMRNSPSIRTVTNVTFFIENDVDLMVSLTGSVDYSHTSGDETQFLFGASIRDLDTSVLLFSEGMEGGNADLLPASGTLSFDGSVVLPAGGRYRFLAVLDADDLAEPNPSIYDANGFANISIRPVPEPHTALLLLFGTAAAVYRRPRRALACDQRAPSPPNPLSRSLLTAFKRSI